MPLSYEKVPPTADDVKLDPWFASHISNESDDDIIMVMVGEEDAHRLATDIERDPDGFIDLAEVRRGLTQAAAILIDGITRSMYLKGVERYIEHQLKPKQ